MAEEPARAGRDGTRLRGSVALPIHVLSCSVGNLGLSSNSRMFQGLLGVLARASVRQSQPSVYLLLRKSK